MEIRLNEKPRFYYEGQEQPQSELIVTFKRYPRLTFGFSLFDWGIGFEILRQGCFLVRINTGPFFFMAGIAQKSFCITLDDATVNKLKNKIEDKHND